MKFLINANKITFKKCGLDVKKNFLQAPECPCGCGGDVEILLDSEDDVAQFCGEMCDENDCQQCAVFAILRNMTCIFALKLGEDIKLYKTKATDADAFSNIGRIADECELHCYGLIVEGNHGGFKIIME